MKLPEQEWFTVRELARRWGVGESYVDQMIESYRLNAKVKKGNGNPASADYIEESNELARFDRLQLSIDPFDRMFWTTGSKIVVTLEEVQRFENKAATTSNKEVAATQPYLDPNHKYYSEELALAVTTWLALYGDNGKFHTRKGHKEQIVKALAGNNLSAAAISRITTLVNPNKSGGAPVTGF